MNRIQNEFIGCMTAVRIDNEKDFNDFIDWASQRNLFTIGNNPVKKMSYPGGDKDPHKTFVVYRHTEDMLVYWGYVGNCPEGYEMVDFKELEMDNSVIEDAATVKNEVTIPEFEKGTIVPAKIEGCNIETLRDVALPIIKRYENIVVTKENFKEIEAICTRLNKEKNKINDSKKEVKNTAAEAVAAFEKTAMEIVKTYENVVGLLRNQIKQFKEEEKQAKKDKIFVDIINPLLEIAISKGMLSSEVAKKFEFNEKWLLSKTTKMDLQTGINLELNRLAELYAREIKDIEFIKSTIQVQCDNANIENNFSEEKYTELLKGGMEPGEVIKLVTNDINNIAVTVNKAVDKVVASNQVESVQNEEVHCDDKTGEVYAKSTENSILVKIQETAPNVPEDKIFSYTYEFEGNCKAILTFNKFLKVLSKLFKSFSFNKIKLVKKELMDPKTKKTKEYKVMEED